SLDIQEKIFSEVAAGITKVLWATSEKFIENSKFQASKLVTILNRTDLKVIRITLVYKSPFVLQTQSKPSKKKDIIKIVYENLTLNSEGQAIIYSSTPNECIEIFNSFKEYIEPHQLGVYHGKMLATNAFGMGVYASHVRTIIHTTFPLSPTNFVQEVGRAGRGGQSAESLVLYACADIRELLMIVGEKVKNADESDSDTEPDSLEMLAVRRRCKHLDRSKKKIFAMAYTFEDSYQCYWKMAYEPFRWPEDPKISECGVCDNCIRCITDNIIWCDISIDLLRILDTVDKLLRFTNDPETQLVTFGRNDIVDVFMKANNKNICEKNLTSLWTNESDDMNDDTVNTLIQTKSMCLHAIDRLCLEGILAQKVIIKPM
ncbi:12260_t:CDS:2, partial [Racocetra persica]